jgi:hypothetical protein
MRYTFWIARFVVPAAVAAHVAVAFMAAYGPAREAYVCLIGLWAVSLLYFLCCWIGGDFIQGIFGWPWGRRDIFQRDLGRAAYAFGYMMLMGGLGFVIGGNYELFAIDAPADADPRMAMLQVLTVIYAGGWAPTAYVGWRLKPLGKEA